MKPENIPFCNLELVNKPFKAEIESTLIEVFRSNHYILGKQTIEFEKEFAKYCGSKFCVSLANATDALEISLKALGILSKDTVMLSANAGGYASTAINNIGAKCAYVDVDPVNMNISVDHLDEKMLRNAKAIIITHLYGNIANIKEIVKIANQFEIKIIEDCSQAHGARINSTHVGNFGDIGCFSFYPTKNLGALGDAGAIITNQPELAVKVQQIKQYGWDKKYLASELLGQNSRMDELQAAILRIKLKELENYNTQRKEMAETYFQSLSNLPLIFQTKLIQDSVFHLFVIREKKRDKLRSYLASHYIMTEIHYPLPDYRQKNFSRYCTNKILLAQTEKDVKSILSLPIYPNQPSENIEKIVEKIKLFYTK